MLYFNVNHLQIKVDVFKHFYFSSIKSLPLMISWCESNINLVYDKHCQYQQSKVRCSFVVFSFLSLKDPDISCCQCSAGCFLPVWAAEEFRKNSDALPVSSRGNQPPHYEISQLNWITVRWSHSSEVEPLFRAQHHPCEHLTLFLFF